MMTVHEVSQISGVSIRALHHYDKIGLLPATKVTDAGYRMYDDTALERLQQILFFKELQFSLKQVPRKRITGWPLNLWKNMESTKM